MKSQVFNPMQLIFFGTKITFGDDHGVGGGTWQAQMRSAQTPRDDTIDRGKTCNMTRR